MKISEAYSHSCAILKAAGIETYDFDSYCLLECFTGFDRAQLLLHPEKEISPRQYTLFSEAVNKRSEHYPLQYIIGEWDFYDMTFYVGTGVLVPRPETEFLVEKALESIPESASKVIFDICSGSGCIGLTVASKRPDCLVVLFELSPVAAGYIVRNIRRNGINNAVLVCTDIKNGMPLYPCTPDVILTNPPYVNSSEIKILSPEVRTEPAMALDGGDDGLDFYRCIADKWLPRLNENGFVIAEFGENQAQKIKEIFSFQLEKSEIIQDFNSIERYIYGVR